MPDPGNDKLYTLYGDVQYIRSQVDTLVASLRSSNDKFDAHLLWANKERDSALDKLKKIDDKVNGIQVKLGAAITVITLALQVIGKWAWDHLIGGKM